MEPKSITYELLKEITDNFSEERKLGEGGFGKVYKGVHKNGEEVAVKMLHPYQLQSNELFKKEFDNIMRLRHENIVRLIGYCHETRCHRTKYEGKVVYSEVRYRGLCFEYMHNGSLQNHLSGERDRLLDWHTRYRIIKDICDGLRYLHERSQPMLHLDLKPDNILLDKNMVAKIADFGVSKICLGGQTMITQNAVGTLRYRPPEFYRNLQSPKFDIYSLGVIIIEIVTGPTGYDAIDEMPAQEFMSMALEKWRSKLHLKWSESTIEQYCEQVKVCMEIALECLQHDRHKRPGIVSIIERLTGKETEADKLQDKSFMDKSSSSSKNSKKEKKQGASASSNNQVRDIDTVDKRYLCTTFYPDIGLKTYKLTRS